MKTKRGIFFDLDGTLVDNEHLKAIAFADAIEQFGGKSNPSIYKEVMGMSGPVIIRHFMDKAGIQVDMAAYSQAYKSRYTSLIKSELAIRPGAINFLTAAKEAGLHLALVSGASSIFVTYIVDTLNLGDYFDFVITSNDVASKKPDPQCYLLALEKMSIANDQAVVFEDTEAGLTAAINAGISTVCIRHAYNQLHHLSYAAAIYDSFENNHAAMNKDINAIFNKPIF